MTDKELLDKILPFLAEINITVIEKELDDDCILPGLAIQENTILMDRSRMKYPGDLLHEAGHLAVTPEEERAWIGTDKMDPSWPSDGDEIAAILWSYAALHHIEIPAEAVFHPGGYKQDSGWLIQQFTIEKNYIGLPLLEWMGFCERTEDPKNTSFPKLKKWLR